MVEFELVKPRNTNASHSGIESVIIMHIIQHFGGNHDACGEQAMDIEWNDQEIRFPVNEAVDIDVGGDETWGVAPSVLVNPFQKARHMEE